MKEEISSNAIIYAILSLNSEITLQKAYLDSGDVPAEERKNEESIVEDLEQAFMEFIGVYKQRKKTDQSLPEIEELLNSEL